MTTFTKATEIAAAPTAPNLTLTGAQQKLLVTAEQYAPTTSTDWTTLNGAPSAPTTITGGLDTLAADAIHQVTGTLTTEELLAMNATPIELIAAPAAGKVIVVESIELFLDFNGVGYTAGAGEDLTIEYSGGTDIATWDNDSDDILVGTADERRYNVPTIYDVIDLTTVDAESVQASIASGELADGDSPMKYKIRYRIETLLT